MPLKKKKVERREMKDEDEREEKDKYLIIVISGIRIFITNNEDLASIVNTVELQDSYMRILL